MFGINVMDFGAKGDGITDDTQAIQAAIDHAAERGGGRVLFPYTKTGYRLGSPAKETYQGMPLRAQLVIPPGRANIQLMGEMPCRMMNSYQVRPMDAVKTAHEPTLFGELPVDNTMIFSDWEAPEEHDMHARPWSMIAAAEGKLKKGKFSTCMFSIANLEFRVPMSREKMYPTLSGVNLGNVSRCNLQDVQICLNEQVGDTLLGKELQKNPCHTAGLIAPADQNDNVVLRNVAVQGFKYGFVLGEHVVAEYLYGHNCEYTVTLHDCSHLSQIHHMVAQHNNIPLSSAPDGLFGLPAGPIYLDFQTLDVESGNGIPPAISQLTYGVYDPDDRLHGNLRFHIPWGPQEFPIFGAKNFTVERFK